MARGGPRIYKEESLISALVVITAGVVKVARRGKEKDSRFLDVAWRPTLTGGERQSAWRAGGVEEHRRAMPL